MRSRHVSTVIRRPAAEVYEFAADPAHLPGWATGLTSGTATTESTAEGDVLTVDSPLGRVRARFVPRNPHGVLDHEVTLPDGTTTHNPLRVLPHPEGAEVVFTLRDTGGGGGDDHDDDAFERDGQMVASDLARLRALLEGAPAAPEPTPPDPVPGADVRLATPADADRVGAMLHEFNAEFGSPSPDARVAARRFAELLARADVLVVVVTRTVTAVTTDIGFALVTLRPTPYWDGPLAQLEELYIRPGMRGRGVGTRVIDRAVTEVRRRGAEEMHITVDSDDTGARRFYARHGFSDLDPDSGAGMRLYLREL